MLGLLSATVFLRVFHSTVNQEFNLGLLNNCWHVVVHVSKQGITEYFSALITFGFAVQELAVRRGSSSSIGSDMFSAPLLVQGSPAGTALTGGLVAASLQLLARMVPIRISLKKSVLSVYFVWLTMGSLTWECLSTPVHLCAVNSSFLLFIVTLCHLQCNEWIQDLLFLLNPSCSFFSRWPWFISPSDLVAITVSADISPACPVPLHLAACEANACRQYSHTSCLPGLVSVGLNC